MGPADMKGSQLYSSRIIDTYIRLIRSRYDRVNVDELLEYAGMNAHEIADQGHWFDQDQVNRFYEKLVQLTGNPVIAREAGRYAASPDALGVMKQYALGLIDPANAFAFIDKASANFTRSSSFTSRRLAANKVEIVVTPVREGLESHFQCENRIGFFEAIVLMFDNRLPDVQHPECVFEGGSQCRYIVSWEMPLSATLDKFRVWTNLVLLAGNATLAATGRWELLKWGVPVSVLSSLLLSIAVEKRKKNEVRKSLDSTRDAIDKLLDQININYNNALVTNEIGRVLSSHAYAEDILADVVQILRKRLDYDRGLILLANAERTKLELQAGFGYSEGEQQQFGKLSFHLDRPDSKGIFVLSFREQKPYLVNNLDDIQETLSPRSLALAKRIGTHSFICCPIVSGDTSLGILAVDNMKSKRPLVQSDMSLLMGIASVVALSIKNVELIDGRMRQFNSILQALAASIDARDSLTAGHSEKVTEYALGICGELGLHGDYREMIRVAALLHDYGKLGIPDAILKKDGKLTAEEYEVVKTHSEKTREILSRIHFEGIYCQVPEIAGAHHEKIDGSGYPKGLRGDDIPLGAKIIAVADYFEAITAKRHYREPMAIDTAFAVLRDAVGSHFDRRLVEGLISYYTKSYLDVRPESPLGGVVRRRPRIPCRTPVSCQVNGRTLSATSEDISVSGIYVAAGDEVQPGVPVTLTIELPDNAQKVKARGRVAWVNIEQQKKPGFPTGFGVELLEFRGATEAIFRNFMSNYAPAAYAMGNA